MLEHVMERLHQTLKTTIVPAQSMKLLAIMKDPKRFGQSTNFIWWLLVMRAKVPN